MRTALQHHRQRLRDRHHLNARPGEGDVAARRTIFLQDRSFEPMRKEGVLAHGLGKLRAENPYLSDTGPFVWWDVGWRDANDSQR